MKKGFSLMVLVITASVMLIIAGAIILTMGKMSDETQALRLLDEMKILQSKILEYQLKHEDNKTKYPYVGTLITETNKINLGSVTYGEGQYTDYYLLEPNNLKTMGIKNINNTYLVNYISQDVVYKKGISINGTYYYSIKDIDEQARF